MKHVSKRISDNRPKFDPVFTIDFPILVFYLKQERLELSILYLKRCHTSAKTTLQKTKLFYEEAHFHYLKKKYLEAKKYLLEAINLFESLTKNEHKEHIEILADCLRSLGSVYKCLNQYKNSKKAYSKSIGLIEKVADIDAYERVKSISNLSGLLASVLLNLKDFEGSHKLFLRSIKLTQICAKREPHLYFERFGNILRDFSIFLAKTGDFKTAVTKSKESLKIFEYLVLSISRRYMQQFAECTHLLSSIYLKNTQFPLAEKTIRTFLNTYNDINPNNFLSEISNLYNYAEIYYILGATQISQNQKELAITSWEKVVAHYRVLMKTQPDLYTTTAIDYFIDLSKLYLLTSHFQPSIKISLEALQICEQFTEKDSKVMKIKIGFIHSNIFLVYSKDQKKKNLALDHSSKALSFLIPYNDDPINQQMIKKIVNELHSMSIDIQNYYAQLNFLSDQISSKINYNDPCLCGSGAKFKFCCLNSPWAYSIKNNYTGQTINFGPMATFGGYQKHSGDCNQIRKNPDEYQSQVWVNLPLLLPLENDSYDIAIGNESYIVEHKITKKGHSIFSNFDSSKLPFFSTFVISSESILVDLSDDQPDKKFAYNIILKILKKIISFVSDELKYDIGSTHEPNLGYIILTQKRGQPFHKNPALVTEIPFTHELLLNTPIIIDKVDQNGMKKYLSQKIKINSFINKKSPGYIDLDFDKAVLNSLIDFMFYSRQHPQVLNSMHEELIRDLYLIILKIIFSSAEGEAYHFDGKTDVKLTNPINKYEFCVMEFKWWHGVASFKEQFKQLVRKHATGQEAMYFMLILSKNKNITTVCNQLQNLLSKEDKYVENSLEVQEIPGLRERIFNAKVLNRNDEEIPLRIFYFDLYYQRV